MYYSNIKECDIANGTGVRVSLFVSGCTNHCPGCFQPQTWNFEYGREFTKATENHIIELLKLDYIQGLTLLGGEPLEPRNQPALLALTTRVKHKFQKKDIWCYTGFVFEDILQEGKYPHTKNALHFLENLDVLVDGRFVEEKKDLSLRFRGSSNQRLIDVQKSLKENRVVLLDLKDRR